MNRDTLETIVQNIAHFEGYYGEVDCPAQRNNNPGNLVFAGQPGAYPSPTGSHHFAVFPTPEMGFDALRAQIRLDLEERGLTPRQFMAKYAPPDENDTDKYLRFAFGFAVESGEIADYDTPFKGGDNEAVANA